MGIFTSRPNAAAIIKGGDKAPDINGRVNFYQINGGVAVEAIIKGLPPGSVFLGFHIHQGGDCGGIGFENTGSHYNPSGKPHPDHSGDLPPLLTANGEAYFAVKTNRFTVSEIIGLTVVIHSKADDFHSQPAGNAGEKIACGVIERR